TGDELEQIAFGAAMASGDRKRCGGVADDEQPDNVGIRDEAEQTVGFQHEDGRVPQVEDDRERQRRQYEQIAGDVLAHARTRRHAADRQERSRHEPECAENRHRNRAEGAVAAQIDLRAADARAHVAEAVVARIEDEAVVHVRRRRRSAQTDERTYQCDASGGPTHASGKRPPVDERHSVAVIKRECSVPADIFAKRNDRLGLPDLPDLLDPLTCLTYSTYLTYATYLTY